MAFTIRFNNLPFEPEKNQVIYIEKVYNEEINHFIATNYSYLRTRFEQQGKDFIYIPFLTTDSQIIERIRYYAPYLNDLGFSNNEVGSSYILDFMARPENRWKIPCSLIEYNRMDEGCAIYSGRSVSANLNSFLFQEPQPEFMIVSSEPDFHKVGRGSYATKNEVSESLSVKEDDESIKLLQELQETVKKLRLNGVPLGVIHRLIDQEEKVSPMVITADYRIFLPDYNNMEIDMDALTKTLYFFFLLHPEGVVLKDLPDHYEAIYRIYRQFKPNHKEEFLRTSVTRLINPLSNRLNEVISRIRSAFVRKFDDHLAQHYYINGEKGQSYKITLDRQLITWEE
ncbi:MAG: hypothetical protein MJZ73_08730 [Bacteroidaceae bacterium]|nr:hypothetical protein [Bacteroidaceae bacterium]